MRDDSFKIYQKLMPFKVTEILFVSSPYDAFIMEEDGILIEEIFSNYHGIGQLSPPRFTVVDTVEEALEVLEKRAFNLVVTMPRFLGMDAIGLGREIKKRYPDLAVVLLVQNLRSLDFFQGNIPKNCIDKIFFWFGNRNIMLAMIKWLEDRNNVDYDTITAMVRVLILVEDSAYYYSSLLPILYESIVKQTQQVLDDSLNEEHRLLKLRARTKVLLAENYEEGMVLFLKYRPYILGLLSDVRYNRNNQMDAAAGIALIERVRIERPDLPVLLLSQETTNQEKAQLLGINFQDKNSPNLNREIKKFLVRNLGFGEFIFRLPGGQEVGKARNLTDMEKMLHLIPNESLLYHLKNNHFSNWLMARSEIVLASKFREIGHLQSDENEIRRQLITSIHDKRVLKKRGVVTNFSATSFEHDSEFLKIGDGSLGGKARGLAFIARDLQANSELFTQTGNITLNIPQTLVLTSECYDQFISQNDFEDFSQQELSDEAIAEKFLHATLPYRIERDLSAFLSKIKMPLAVRSSSLLEDSKYWPYAGMYKTYMLANNQPPDNLRLENLSRAIKLVYASVFYQAPRSFAKTTLNRIEEEKMAVVIQPLVGDFHGDYFYPAISGTAQSYNYYPVSYMRIDEGIANIAYGFGKTVVEGGLAVRFSPAYPQFLPQFSSVNDILKNTQKYFYALSIANTKQHKLLKDDNLNLVKRDINDAINDFPLKMLSSSFFYEDNCIRDGWSPNLAVPVLTFANLLKNQPYPVATFIGNLLKVAKQGMGCDVEIEFAFNYPANSKLPLNFYLLQVRPMITSFFLGQIHITDEERSRALCHSKKVLGAGEINDLVDVIYVDPEALTTTTTVRAAQEIGRINALLTQQGKKYLLMGPGRWGSADQNLGIPVNWNDISSVAAIVEIANARFNVDPSQGTHFFQNITSLGIGFLAVSGKDGKVDWAFWEQLKQQQEVSQNVYHFTLSLPLIIKIDSQAGEAVILSSNKSLTMQGE